MLEELSAELQGKVKIVKLNVDENPSTTVKYGVRSIPTMILFKDGEAADMKIGAGTPKAGLASGSRATLPDAARDTASFDQKRRRLTPAAFLFGRSVRAQTPCLSSPPTPR